MAGSSSVASLMSLICTMVRESVTSKTRGASCRRGALGGTTAPSLSVLLREKHSGGDDEEDVEEVETGAALGGSRGRERQVDAKAGGLFYFRGRAAYPRGSRRRRTGS